jgi:hypothetical protein
MFLLERRPAAIALHLGLAAERARSSADVFIELTYAIEIPSAFALVNLLSRAVKGETSVDRNLFDQHHQGAAERSSGLDQVAA